MKEILGRGGIAPSPIETCINQVKKGDYKKAREILSEELWMLLGEIDKKNKVWGNRVELDRLRSETLDEFPELDLIDDIKADVLNRSAINLPGAQKREFWEISQDEPPTLRHKIDLLNNEAVIIKGICGILWDICNWEKSQEGTQLDLIEDPMKSRASPSDLLQTITSNAGVLGLILVEGSPLFTWQNHDAGTSGQIDISDKKRAYRDLADYCLDLVQGVRTRIAKAFPPNIARKEMPDPFLINFEPDIPVVNSNADDIAGIYKPSFKSKAPESVMVAMPCVMLPPWFSGERYTYNGDSYRSRVEEFAKRCIKTAQTEGAHVIVFPEYFLPREGHIEQILAFAKENNICLIGGLEGRRNKEGMLVNEAVICMPDTREYYQQKHRPSNKEVELHSGKEQYIFPGTPIGTFSVVMCSDLTEMDILDAIRRKAPVLDYIFVLCQNDRPDIFKTYAQADAWRFYTHVIVCNHVFKPADSSTLLSSTQAGRDLLCEDKYFGSLCCSPCADEQSFGIRTVPIAPILEIPGNLSIVLNTVQRINIFKGTHLSRPGHKCSQVPHCRKAVLDIAASSG